MVGEQTGGHLAAARVVDADEENFGDADDDGSCRLGEGTEACTSEAANEDGQERLHLGVAKVVKAPDQIGLDEPNLAMSLNNLSIRLGEAGRREDAERARADASIVEKRVEERGLRRNESVDHDSSS